MFKVSVIISCYKNEKDIQRAIESCANQTLDSIEVIVVNDGSPDNSQAIVDEMVKKYPAAIKQDNVNDVIAAAMRKKRQVEE